MRGLKLFPLLDGYRGRPKADLDAAIDAIVGHRRVRCANADAIEELDINPLIVCAEGQGAWIADALLVRRDALRWSRADGRTTSHTGSAACGRRRHKARVSEPPMT